MINQARKVSLHERMYVSGRHIGYPSILSVLVVYPSTSSVPPRESLTQRIEELQLHFPLLYSRVLDNKNAGPSFELNDERWKGEDVLRESEYQFDGTGKETIDRLLSQEIQHLEKQDTAARPLWQVTILKPSESNQEDGKAYLVLSVDHAIADGIGLIRLLQALVSKSIVDLPTESLSRIKRLEETVDISPTYSMWAWTLFKNLVLPRLPNSLQHTINPMPWPTKPITHSPLSAKPCTYLVSIPNDAVTTIKSLGKQWGVKTLHPILATASMIALRIMLGSENSKPTSIPAIRISSARSVRNKTLGHGHCTAIYVAASHYTLTDLNQNDFFWTMVKNYVTICDSPKSIAEGQKAIGFLAHVLEEIPAGNGDEKDPRISNGWDHMLLYGAKGPRPYFNSMFLSNLGYSPLPPRSEDMVWSQSAPLAFSPVTFNYLGHQGGLRVSLTWRDGPAITRSEVEKVAEIFVRSLVRLAGTKGEGRDVTVGELVEDR